MKVRLRRFLKNFKLIAGLVVIVVLLYLEVYLYVTNSHRWEQLKCENEKICTRIILVADPQLIGKQNEIVHFLTPLSIWDSDRFLFKTYQKVFEFVKPDVVIFLGDLFDEGSVGTDSEFNSYARRLFNIFLHKRFALVKHIWLPGDNDIGGEGRDFVTSKKLQRFNRAFQQPDIIEIRNISFYKINRFIDSIPKISDNKEFFNVNTITVGLSHMPLLFIPSTFVDKVLAKVQPHVLFTAHEHKSMIISTDGVIREDRHIVPVNPDNKKTYKYTLGINSMYEIIVPTCSYRMGTTKIGYGFAIIENDELQYTVLWSPTRFPQVIFYLLVCIILTLTVFCKVCCRMLRYKSKCKNSGV